MADENLLYYGDNLDVLRHYIRDESVDLIYLDPPFKSERDYNLLFKTSEGVLSESQIKAFKDTWSWDQEAAATYQDIVETGGELAETMQGFWRMLRPSTMLAYLVMMAPRLAELRRVLKPTGSIYLHCDPSAGHYLKLLMDSLFGVENFRTQIIWKRTSAHSDTKQGRRQHGRIHDMIFFYSKSNDWTWNPLYVDYDPDYVEQFYKYVEEGTGRRYRLGDLTGPGGARKGNPRYEVMGVTRYWRYSKEKMDELIRQGRVVQVRPGAVPAYKRYLDEMPGIPLQDVWTDIKPIGAQAKERLGYPTQKPEALLERIIASSSNEGDMVLDPFCGCGTAVAVAQWLNRRWIGIDITHMAINLIKYRLWNAFGDTAKYRVVGEPVTLDDAQALAQQNPYQFEFWALGLVGARPTEQKRGADQGIDGRLYFHDEPTAGKTKQIVISVKSGKTGVAHVRDLRGVVEREHAEIGVLITLHEPTQPMRSEAAGAGFYESRWGRHPRLQILTIADLLAGQGIDYPPSQQVNVTFKRAPRARNASQAETLPLPLDEEQ